VDCPELPQSYGQQAHEFTAALLLNKKVTVKTSGRFDLYGRLLSEIVIDKDKDVATLLLKSGMAWYAESSPKRPLTCGKLPRNRNCFDLRFTYDLKP
jgi:endonuclease YncB( thermonuclease family)